MGGLANRMRAMASGLALARSINGEPIHYKVVWRENADLRASFSDLLDPGPWDTLAEIIHPGTLAYSLMYEPPRRRNLYLSAPFQKLRGSALFDDGKLPHYRNNPQDLAQLVLNRKETLIGSGCVFYPFDDSELRSLFKPSVRVESVCMEWVSRFTANTLGVHIRRTDNAMSIKHSPTALFVDEIAKWIESYGSQARVFLATDDEPTKEELMHRFGPQLIVNDRAASRTTQKGMVDGAAEMFALSRCASIIGSHYSSYSEMAAAIGGVPFRQLYV